MHTYEIFLASEEKSTYLHEHGEGPQIQYQKVKCLLCGLEFATFNFKATLEASGQKTIRCADWPQCDGTIADWIEPGQ